MPTTTILLRLTDGTTTCDFSTTSTTFALRAPGWEPAVATLRDNDLGGQSRYSDVDESIPLYALGTTAAVAHTNITALERLLTIAKRAERGEVQASVWLECQLQGSDLSTYLRSRVRGGRIERLGPEYAEGALYAPAGIPLDLVVSRRGQWILATEEQSSQDTSFTSYDTAALTFSSSPSTSNHPLRVTISGLTATTTSWQPGYLVVAPSGSHIQLHEAETTYATGTSVAGTGARGGNVRRFTTDSHTAAFAVGATLGAATQFHFLASIAIGSGAWYAWGRIYLSGGGVVETPEIALHQHTRGTPSAPQIIALPPVTASSLVTLGEIFFRGSGVLECDYVVLAGDAQLVRIGDPGGYPTTTPIYLEVDAKPVLGLKPGVRVVTGAGAKPVRYEEDAYLVSPGGNTVGVAWLQMEYQPTGAEWVVTATGPGTGAKVHTVTVYRSLAYTVAQ